MENKFFFKPTKYKSDDNLAFSYFRSFITFYYCTLFSSNKSLDNIKKYYKRGYGSEKYFSLFKKEFLDLSNPLIFTYFNTIHHIFFPYFEEMYLYFPIITFYGKDGFYKKGFINYPGKINGLYQKNFKISDKEIQITIPINLLISYKFPEDYYILIKIGTKIVASNNVKVLNGEMIIKNYKLKTKRDYKNTGEDLKVKLDEIELAYVLVPITKEGMSNIFKIDTLKKDSWIYHIYYKIRNKSYDEWFHSLYPKINMFFFPKLNKDWKCIRSKIVKDLNVLNLTVDVFYNNEIVNRKTNNSYLDLRDEKYENILQDDLFRCLSTDNELDKRRDICNFNIIHTYGEDTFKKNMGKKMLNLLIFKNHTFINYSKFYYIDFIKKFQYGAFIYHYGYMLYKNKKIFYDMELGFINSDIISEYLKKIDEVEGECHKIYKKGKLNLQ
jgi:hypothetical protein